MSLWPSGTGFTRVFSSSFTTSCAARVHKSYAANETVGKMAVVPTYSWSDPSLKEIDEVVNRMDLDATPVRVLCSGGDKRINIVNQEQWSSQRGLGTSHSGY